MWHAQLMHGTQSISATDVARYSLHYAWFSRVLLDDPYFTQDMNCLDVTCPDISMHVSSPWASLCEHATYTAAEFYFLCRPFAYPCCLLCQIRSTGPQYNYGHLPDQVPGWHMTTHPRRHSVPCLPSKNPSVPATFIMANYINSLPVMCSRQRLPLQSVA